METLTAGSVVITPFPFSDMSSYKYRPALVLGRGSFANLILCQITSRKSEKMITITIESSSFSQGRLPVTSYIRPDKLFTIDQKLLTGKVGTLNHKVLDEVKATLSQLLDL